jgi:hypothetical protein
MDDIEKSLLEFNKTVQASLTATHRAEMVLRDFGLALTRNDDGSLCARGAFDVSDQSWPALPDLSMVDLEGDFNCRDNCLTSLKGLPRTITGTLDCRGNPDLLVFGDAPSNVKIVSDYGSFATKEDMPAELQATAKEHQGSLEATVMRKPVKVGPAISFRKPSGT